MKNKLPLLIAIIFCICLCLFGNYFRSKICSDFFIFNGHVYEFTNEDLTVLGVDTGNLKLTHVATIQSNSSYKLIFKNKELESDILPVGTKVYFIEYLSDDINDPNILIAIYNGNFKIARRNWTT